MNLSRCANGHFYDKEKYASCPHCSGGGASDESLTTVFTEDVTVPITPAAAPQPVPQAAPAPQPAPMPQAPVPPVAPMPVFGESPAQANPFPVAGMAADQLTVDFDNSGYDSVTVPLDQQVSPMNMGMENAADDDDDHTVGFFDNDFFGSPAPQSAPAPQPVSAPQPAPVMPAEQVVRAVNKVSTPCVGWLIALGGEHIGTDFRLKVGKNFIGRSPQMDVALTDDKSVSRDKHAIVVYEPKMHLYLVQPGESSSLVYRNNEVVLSPVKLEAYDMITVGEINLLFIPLCGERFNWSDLFDEMKKSNK